METCRKSEVGSWKFWVRKIPLSSFRRKQSRVAKFSKKENFDGIVKPFRQENLPFGEVKFKKLGSKYIFEL